MQLPPVDRPPSSRPAGADVASAPGPKVVPVAPVNPPAAVAAPEVVTPGVVNKIGEVVATNPSQLVYTSVSDPARHGSEASTGSKDWTIRRPEPEKVEDPPPQPISEILLEFLQSVWRASGTAVEAAQAQNQNTPVNTRSPIDAPGQFAKENVTYSPSKIKKNEKL